MFCEIPCGTFVSFQTATPISSPRSPAAHLGSREHQIIFPLDDVSLENFESHFTEELNDAESAHQHGHSIIITGELDSTIAHSNFDGSVLVPDTTLQPVPETEAIFPETEEISIVNSHFQNEELEVVPKEPERAVSTTEERLGQDILDLRAARSNPRIRAFRTQAVTPVTNITKTGELSPPCGCYTCGTCGATHLGAGHRGLITCPAGFDRCCFPEDPWPDFVATEAESMAPCALPSRCRRSYGVSPLDVQLFGVLLPCYLGQVRCLDLLLQEAELMSPLPNPPPCPAPEIGRAAAGSGFPTPIPDIDFKEMSLSEPGDLPTRPHGSFKNEEGREPTTEIPPSDASAHFEMASSSQPEPDDIDYDRSSPTQPGEEVMQGSGNGQQETPVAVKKQTSVPTFFEPVGSGSSVSEGAASNNSNLLPAREYLLPTEPFHAPKLPTPGEKVIENPLPVTNGAYLPPALDADEHGQVLGHSTRTPVYGTQGSELYGSASSLIPDLNPTKFSENFDLDESASSFDYAIDEAEPAIKLAGTPLPSAPAHDSEKSNHQFTDDLATAASLLFAVGGSHHHHHNPEHHHQQHGDHSDQQHGEHGEHSESSVHQFPSSGLHVIPAPDLSLLPPQFTPESEPSADFHADGGFLGDGLPKEQLAVPQPRPPIENAPESEPALPETYLPVPIEGSRNSNGASQQSGSIHLTVSESNAKNHNLKTDITETKPAINNNPKEINSDSPAGTVFHQFMGTNKAKSTFLKFPDSVSVEIKESPHSSVQIPIPCRPFSNCERLFMNSSHEFEVLGSLPGCPRGEGRCLDHVLMVYTRLGRHEQVLFGDTSSLKTDGTIIEIKSAPIAGEDGTGQSMVVHGPPGFRKTVALFGGKLVFPAASDDKFPNEVPSLEKEESFASEMSHTVGSEVGQTTPVVVTIPGGKGGTVGYWSYRRRGGRS